MRQTNAFLIALAAMLMTLCVSLQLYAQNLPSFTYADNLPTEKKQFLPAISPWQPTSPLVSTSVFSEDFEKGATKWKTYGTDWQISQGRAEATNYRNGTTSYLISPVFNLPQGKFKLKYKEKYALESYRDFGAVWITTDQGTHWRRVHTVTGVTDWRDTYIDLRAYQNQQVQFAFMLKTDETVSGAGWQIDDLGVVEVKYAKVTPTNARVTASAQQLQNALNAALTGRETNTFPTVSATVRVEGMPNLTQSNFTVCENGEVQTEYNVIPPQGGTFRPADIVFIVDNSGSMSPYQTAIQNSVTDFVNDLFDAGIDAALGLIRFGQAGGGFPIVEENGTLFTDPEFYLNSIFSRNVDNGSTEPGLDAILESVSEFNFRPNSQKIFIILTDEEHNGSFTQASAVLPILEQNAITLFSIIDSDYRTSQEDYGDLAIASGGQQFEIIDLFDPATLSPIIDAIEDNIATDDTYIISYVSENPTLDGVERVVDIKVTVGSEADTVTFSYTPGAAPSVSLVQSTLDLVANPQPKGNPITVQVNITDLDAPFVQSATLFYRTTGETTYISVGMTNVSGDLWEATIPASSTNAPGVDFYITATDGISTTSDRPSSPAQNPYQIAINPNVAPVITSTPVNSLNVGEDLMITATITDNTDEVASAFLFYRGIGEPLYQSVPLSNSGGNTYEVTVSASNLPQNGVQYYIKATDNFGISFYFGEPQDPIEVEIISSQPTTTLSLTPATVTVDENEEVCVLAELTDQNGDPISEETISFEVSGTNTASGAVETDENGQAEFCYTPTAAGTDVITASFNTLSDQTAVTINSIPVNGPEIISFTLIDVNTDQDLQMLMDGDVIFGNSPLGIRANTSPQEIGSVRFELTGPLTKEVVENRVPYSLFGDDNGDYDGEMLPTGLYTLTATPYSERRGRGTAGTPLTIQFEVIDAPAFSAVVESFTLVDADTDQDIGPLADGDVLDLTTLSASLVSVRATVSSESTGSVRFVLNGPLSKKMTENRVPYSLFGDGNGDYVGELLPPGQYTLTATPYSERRGRGTAGTPLTIQFEVIDAPAFSAVVESFTLVDADTDQDIGPLEDGDVLDLTTLGASLFNVRANVSPGSTSSVRLVLNGPLSKKMIENQTPYSLFGDNKGDYEGELLLPGEYTLTATPYSAPRGKGFAGTALSVMFTVVDGSSSRMASHQPKLGQESFSELSFTGNEDQELIVYPIPSPGTIYISVPKTDDPARLSVFDALGKLVYSSADYEQTSLDLRPHGKGVYFVRLLRKDRIYTKRIMIE